jgi:hypothetical protein
LGTTYVIENKYKIQLNLPRTVSLPGSAPLTNISSFVPTGMTSFEMAISTGFFDAFPNVNVFYFGLEAVNGLGSKGKKEVLPHAVY